MGSRLDILNPSSPKLQVKRRFEVHLPVSQKRRRANEAEEPQQNPLHALLTKKKTAPGLEALLSEARKENPVAGSKNRISEELNRGPNFRDLHPPRLVSSTAQPGWNSLVSPCETAILSGKHGGSNREGKELCKGAKEGIWRKSTGGLPKGGLNGSRLQSDDALRKSESDGSQAGTPRKKKKLKRSPVLSKAVTKLVSSQPKASIGKLKQKSPVGGKKRASFSGEKKGGNVGKSGNQTKEPVVNRTVTPQPPQSGKSSKPQAPKSMNDLSRERGNGGTASIVANGGPADVSMRAAPGVAERPLLSEARGLKEGPAAQPAFNHSANPGSGHGLPRGGYAQATQKAPSKSGWDVPGPTPGMGFATNLPTGPWNPPMPGGFHTGFQPGFPPEASGGNAFPGGLGPAGGYGVSWPAQAGHLSQQAQECQRLWEALQRSVQTWHR